MDEEVQRDILAMGVPMANQCERTETVIRRLKRKFPGDDDDDDDDFELPIDWSLNEKFRMVRVTYSNGDEDSFTMDEVLNTENIRFLQQLLNLTPPPIITTRIVIMFKSRMSFRLNQLMKLNANVVNDEYEERDDVKLYVLGVVGNRDIMGGIRVG
ncbi:hypothetical protein Hanom_Chr08g00738211 [Helianthus anomalus]